MSQPCATCECKRVSRALCHCCQQNFCLQHLNEHNMFLVSQLNPLTDELNTLSDRLNRLDVQQILADCQQKLDQWRLTCHEVIDRFVERKCRELNDLITEKVDVQHERTIEVQSKVAELLRKQEATQLDISSIKSRIHELTRGLDAIERTCPQISSRPLLIDDTLVEVTGSAVQTLDSSWFLPAEKYIQQPPRSSKVIAANERFLMMHRGLSLSLINRENITAKETTDIQGAIFDMCWSPFLAAFIVITSNEIFIVNENTMTTKVLQVGKRRRWFSCTCSEQFLFLSTRGPGQSVLKLRLLPSIMAINECRAPNVSASDERIDNIVYHAGKIAVLISNPSKKTMRMDLRSSDSFIHVWTLSLDVVCHESISTRCCSIRHNEWLVADFHGKRLVQITSSGKIKATIPYSTAPYRVSMFGPNVLAIVDENGVNFHKLQDEE